MDIIGNLLLTIAKDHDNHLIVSIILQNEQCADNARNIMSTLILKGTAHELENGFFENINRPMQAASGLLVSMEAFMKQLEEVRQHSAMEKEKTEKEKKMKEETNKKYKEAMQKVDELEKEGRYRDAWLKLPDAVQFPEQTETIESNLGRQRFAASETGLYKSVALINRVNRRWSGTNWKAETIRFGKNNLGRLPNIYRRTFISLVWIM